MQTTTEAQLGLPGKPVTIGWADGNKTFVYASADSDDIATATFEFNGSTVYDGSVVNPVYADLPFAIQQFSTGVETLKRTRWQRIRGFFAFYRLRWAIHDRLGVDCRGDDE